MPCTLLLLAACPVLAAPAPVIVANDEVRRELTFDGHVWRTTALARADGRDALALRSDEFHLLWLDDREASIDQYEVDGEPVRQGRDRLTIAYRPRVGADLPPVTLTYWAGPGATLRKTVTVALGVGQALDRLEVERFAVTVPAARGGRGEPVFLDGRWFCGLEYPAGHSRHTDGNTPAADSHHYEKVGNYSYVDLDGRDRLKTPAPGLVRLFHFPGEAGADGRIVSKTAVAGIGMAGQTSELAFADYLATVARPDRSFLHYNNWFDGSAKNLRGDALVKVLRQFKQRLDAEGITVAAMVPDNGWQNGSSLWEPSAGHFAGGMADLAKLGRDLRGAGSSLGLWLSLDSTTCNIGWGEQHGYARAKANAYFSQYFAHYSLSQPKYRADLEAQLRRLVREGGLTYFKHDFNHLSDIGPGHDHPATDRHGHEANVDAMIALLAASREENPALYQNLTNWMWFSPWWLMHGDALWMLAGDDGFNRNWPELSGRAMATTDRDTYLWRMWGDPADRPLVPISRLMTHGIIRNPGGQMESKGDTPADWADHVWMHYGRGTQLKEWYITPAAMDEAHWQPLIAVHKWAERHFRALTHTVFVGGRPDEGHVYGYVGWDGERGVLVARNPNVAAQTLIVPCDASTLFRGATGRDYRARVVYPEPSAWPTAYRSGQPMAFELPGYTTMVFEIEPGQAEPLPPMPAPPAGNATSIALPDEAMPRCELLVIGYDELPTVTLDGQPATPVRANDGAVNHFAGYARAGMPSATARMWRMAAFDLRGRRGQPVALGFSGATRAEAWLLLDRPVAGLTRRQTVCLLPETQLKAPPPRHVTDAEWAARRAVRLRLDTFGLESWAGGAASVELNGQVVATLTEPKAGDTWHTQTVDLPLDKVLRENKLVIVRGQDGDKWKLRRATLEVQLADGTWVPSNVGGAQTSHGDWAYHEGETFADGTRSRPMALEFP